MVSLEHLKEFLAKWKRQLGKLLELLYEDIKDAIQMQNDVNQKESLHSCKYNMEFHQSFYCIITLNVFIKIS